MGYDEEYGYFDDDYDDDYQEDVPEMIPLVYEGSLEGLDEATIAANPRADISLSIAVRKDGLITIHPRANLPCYGELAKYKITHGEMGSVNKHRPGDLHYPFPDGEVLKISVFNNFTEDNVSFWTTEKSPLLRGFGSPENISLTNGVLLLKETDVDPSVFFAYLYTMGYYTVGVDNDRLKTVMGENLMLWTALYGSIFKTNNRCYPMLSSTLGCQSGPFSFRRILEQDPRKISMGTFREGYGYTRPGVEHLFRSKSAFDPRRHMIDLLAKKGIVQKDYFFPITPDQYEIIRDCFLENVEVTLREQKGE